MPAGLFPCPKTKQNISAPVPYPDEWWRCVGLALCCTMKCRGTSCSSNYKPSCTCYLTMRRSSPNAPSRLHNTIAGCWQPCFRAL